MDICPPRVPLTLAVGCAWRRGGLFGCVGSGVRVLADGLSACWNLGFLCRPFLLFPWPVVGRQWFMATSCGDDMSKANFFRGSSEGRCFLRGRQSALIACLSGQRGVHIVRTFVHGRLLDLHFGPSLLALPSALHTVLFCRRREFAAPDRRFLTRSGFSGNVVAVSVAGVRSVDRVQVCGIRTLLPGAVLV